MKNKIYFGLAFILILTGTTYVVLKNSNTSKSTPSDSVYFNLGIKLASTNIPVEISFKNEKNERFSKKVYTRNSTNSIVSFDLPASKEIHSLKIQLDTLSKFSLIALNISQGDFTKSFTATDLVAVTKPLSALVKKNGRKVECVSLHQNKQYGVIFKSPIKTLPIIKTIPFGIIMGLLFLSVSISVLVYHRKKSRNVLIGFLLATFLGLSAKYFMKIMREEVGSIAVELSIAKTSFRPFPVEFYYSFNGAFDPRKILTDTIKQPLKESKRIEFPGQLNRYIRLDFPQNDTLELKTITLHHWLGKTVVSNKDLLNYFPLLNDIQIQHNNKGAIIFVTGKEDPFIILSHTPIQQKIAALHYKKEDYPFWIACFFFFILFPFLALPSDRKNTLFISVFCLFLSIPGITMMLKKDVFVLDTEKRLAHQKPTFNQKSFKTITTDISDYVNDQFGGRTGFISRWNTLKIVAFRQSDHASPVLIGKNGWMFYVAEGVREMYENKHPIDDVTLKKMKTVLEQRHYWLANQGIDYYFVIPPLSHTMYEEYLPNKMRRINLPTKLDQLLNYLKKSNSPVKVIDLRKALFAAKKKEKYRLYYKEDSHWNLLGAYYGYKALYDRIRKDHPSFPETHKRSDYNWFFQKTNEGDLASLMSLNNYFLREEIIPNPKKGFQFSVVPSVDYPTYESIHEVVTHQVTNEELPTMVMNRDSYTNYIMPFLSDHFKRSVYLWTPKFNAQIIKDEHPTIVITEMLERFIPDLVLDNPQLVIDELKNNKRK